MVVLDLDQVMKLIENQLLILISALLGLCCNSLDNAGQNSSTKNYALIDNDTIFGLKVKPVAAALLKEVEGNYKKNVQKEISHEPSSTLHATAKIRVNGEPYILFYGEHEVNEVNLVHELWHHKLLIEGVPLIKWEFGAGADTGINTELLFNNVWDPIMHTRFFPIMQRQGYDVDHVGKKGIQDQITIELKEKVDPLIAALVFFKPQLEVLDNDLKSLLKQWFINNGLKSSLELGEKMASVVDTSKIDTPEQQIEVLIKCLNILMEGKARFEVQRWENMKLGEINVRAVVIKIHPPS